MAFVADILLIAGALSVALYCYVLAKRLKRFTMLESGMGGAIAVLSGQVDELTRTLERAESAANASATILRDLTERSEVAATNLQVMLASLHDVAPMESETTESDRRIRFIRRRGPKTSLEAAE